MANFAFYKSFSAALLGLGVLANSAFAQAPTPIDQAVHEYIDAIKSATTHEEYHQIDFQLEHSRQGLFGADTANVFESLSRLAPEEIVYFYTEINDLTNKLSIEHRSLLNQKIQSYIDLKVSKLKSNRPKLTPCRANSKRIPQPTLGPSTALVLDNASAKTVTSAGLPECHINLTFDDGPDRKLTEQLLSALAAQNTRVNFYVLGRQVQSYPDITRKTAQAGHIIGNHTMNHENLPKSDFKQAQIEIASGFNVLLNLFGEYIPFFRFPYGASTKNLKAYVYQHNWLDFFWTMDTLDWKLKDPEQLYKHTLTEIEREKRGVILFHDVHPQTIAVVPFILSELNEAGYTSIVITPKEVLKRAPN
jgi:peptidoglycan-N-acetylglucosamine deacetylase